MLRQASPGGLGKHRPAYFQIYCFICEPKTIPYQSSWEEDSIYSQTVLGTLSTTPPTQSKCSLPHKGVSGKSFLFSSPLHEGLNPKVQDLEKDLPSLDSLEQSPGGPWMSQVPKPGRQVGFGC